MPPQLHREHINNELVKLNLSVCGYGTMTINSFIYFEFEQNPGLHTIG